MLQLFFASCWGLERATSFNGPVWSISVEVLVYLVFFLVLKLAGAAVWVSIAIVMACLLARAFGIVSSVLDCLQYFIREESLRSCISTTGQAGGPTSFAVVWQQ
jgi:peptidoglycan/LPS O-acetylase OafA/YrhL